MPRVRAIWENETYQIAYRRLENLEQTRVYCCHGIMHLLDTARIMWILNLERGLGFKREVVYAAALLHDIGKADQYEQSIPHEEMGATRAQEILNELPVDLQFSSEEVCQIVTAIRGHRHLRADAEALEQLLFQADKASRACFACLPKVREACTWPDEKKNLDIRI